MRSIKLYFSKNSFLHRELRYLVEVGQLQEVGLEEQTLISIASKTLPIEEPSRLTACLCNYQRFAEINLEILIITDCPVRR